MDDPRERAIAAVEGHPAVTRAEFAGSRSRGTHQEHSDWDFAIQTDDFEALARDMPRLVEPLEPLAKQWEPLGDFPVYMVLLRGPTKVEYLFLDHSQQPRPPLTPSGQTLTAIDAHFWDWIWWIATKASVGRDDLVAEHMPQLYGHILGPMGAEAVPADLEGAIAEYLSRRAALERRFGIEVPRRLEDEVRAGIRRISPPGLD
jgi:predicted nucleotidyltransferase